MNIFPPSSYGYVAGIYRPNLYADDELQKLYGPSPRQLINKAPELYIDKNHKTLIGHIIKALPEAILPVGQQLSDDPSVLNPIEHSTEITTIEDDFDTIFFRITLSIPEARYTGDVQHDSLIHLDFIAEEFTAPHTDVRVSWSHWMGDMVYDTEELTKYLESNNVAEMYICHGGTWYPSDDYVDALKRHEIVAVPT